MNNVFDQIKETMKNKFGNHIDLSIKSCVSDPHNSILKTYSVMDELITELYLAYELKKTTTDSYKLINELRSVVDDDVINDLHQIRIIRNKAAHKKETSYDGTEGGDVDVAEAIFALKKLYDILGWYINLYNDPIAKFTPFQEVITDVLDKSIERVQKQSQDKTGDSISSDITIGQFVQTTVIDLLERNSFSEEEINSYTLNEFSFVNFGLVLPFLSPTRSGKYKGRYYTKPAKINGKKYYICNGWNDNNKPKLYAWVKSKKEQYSIK